MPYFLQDGTYPVQLAIKTVFGVESAPAVGSITVLNVPGPTIEAAFNARLSAIEISWETTPHTPNTSYCVTVSPLRARRAAGSQTVCVPEKHVYTVRGVTPEGYYGDSAPVHAFLAIENAVIGSVEDGAPWLKLRLRAGERPAHDGSYSAQVDYVHYYGRTKPEPYTCGMQDASHDFAFNAPGRRTDGRPARPAGFCRSLQRLLGRCGSRDAGKHPGGPWPRTGCTVHGCRDRSQAGDQL